MKNLYKEREKAKSYTPNLGEKYNIPIPNSQDFSLLYDLQHKLSPYTLIFDPIRDPIQQSQNYLAGAVSIYSLINPNSFGLSPPPPMQPQYETSQPGPADILFKNYMDNIESKLDYDTKPGVGIKNKSSGKSSKGSSRSNSAGK